MSTSTKTIKVLVENYGFVFQIRCGEVRRYRTSKDEAMTLAAEIAKEVRGLVEDRSNAC